MVGRLAALLGPLLVYYSVSPHLWRAATWWDVAWIACVLMPAVFGLVLIALPWRQASWLLPVGLAFAVAAAVLTVVHVKGRLVIRAARDLNDREQTACVSGCGLYLGELA